MFMAEKLIITEEVKKQNNMAFKMRSGNKVSFKNMGSSSVKQKENLPRDPGDRGTEVKWDNVRQEYIPINMPKAKTPPTPQPAGPKPTTPAKDMKTGSYEHSFESPVKQGYNPTPTKEEQAKKMMERIEKNPHEDKGKGYTPISKEKMRPSELERGEDPHKDKGKGYNPTPKKYKNR